MIANVRLKFSFKVWIYLVQACLKNVVNVNVNAMPIYFPSQALH